MYYQVLLVVLALVWRETQGQCTSLPGNAKSTRYFTAGGTVADGTACCFPFIYKYKAYYNCITADNGDVPWCSADSFYDKMNGLDKWGNCVDSQKLVTVTPPTSSFSCNTFSTSALSTTSKTTGGTVPANTPCCFPFVYKNKLHTGCITDDNNGKPWCCPESIYNPSTEKWGNCITTGGTTPAPPPYKCNVYPNSVYNTKPTKYGTVSTYCCFPFVYKGKPYYSCTTVDNNNKAWCSVDSVYQGRWGLC